MYFLFIRTKVTKPVTLLSRFLLVYNTARTKKQYGFGFRAFQRVKSINFISSAPKTHWILTIDSF